MFCIHCGTSLPDAARFCSSCGKRLADAASNEIVESSLPDNSQEDRKEIKLDELVKETGFPVSDIDPIKFLQGLIWTVFSENNSPDPHKWILERIDMMFSDDYVFIMPGEQDKSISGKLTLAAYYAGGILGGVVGAAIPVVGIAAGLAAIAASGSDKKKQRKHPGFGKHEQFRPERLIEQFCTGNLLWAKKQDCQFIAMRSGFLDPQHYFAITGKFSGIGESFNLALFKDIHPANGSDFKKGMANEAGCPATSDIKVGSRNDAFKQLGIFSKQLN